MTPNSDPGARKRLDSWKEIAAFLGRGERTVKRWEAARKLPIHRIPGGGRSAVYAYTDELTQWLDGASEDLEEDEVSSGAPAAVVDHPGRWQADASIPAAHPGRTGVVLRRIVALLIPPLLIVTVIYYFSGEWSGRRVRAIGEPTPSELSVLNRSLGPDSVAVLPFTNVRGDADSEYLVDGITESLIGNLARIPKLKVRSRDSVFRYKGKDAEARRTGGELGVSTLVSGRVLLRGDTIEVSVELTRVPENIEIWGRRYEGKSGNLIVMQQHIAGDIAKELRSTLSDIERQQVARQGTQNAEAYALYTKGRYAWNKRNRAEIDAAISYFNQAIARDPQYALAYAGIADAYSVLPNYGGNPAEDFPKSNTAAHRAMELDPTLARPHAVLGMNETEYEWDFVSGEAEFKTAIELDPTDATAHQWYAEKLSQQGRYEEALVEINRARQLDPSSLVITRVLAGTLLDAGRSDEAIAICTQLAKENPTFAMAHDCLAFAHWHNHMYAQVVEDWRISAQMTGDPQDVALAAALEQGYRSAGWTGAMTRAAVAFKSRRQTGYASPFRIAGFYASAGDKEQAFHWLDVAYREHDRLLMGLNNEFQLDNLRSDPRFVALVRKVGLPAKRVGSSDIAP